MFENKIIDHPDYHEPGVGEALARMSLAWALTVYPAPPALAPYYDFAHPTVLAAKVECEREWYQQAVARIAGSMIERQVWLDEVVKRTACDILGDICHSDNHQNQDVADIGSDQWWVLADA